MIFFAILMFPIIEISLAIAVIREFGFPNAFFAWLVSLILGIGLIRTSGLRLTVGVAQAMREGKPPGVAAIDGALVGLAGVLFILPGNLSDVMAVLLLFGPFRRASARRLVHAVTIRTAGGARAATGPSSQGFDASSAVIDVDAVVLDDESNIRDVHEVTPVQISPRKS